MAFFPRELALYRKVKLPSTADSLVASYANFVFLYASLQQGLSSMAGHNHSMTPIISHSPSSVQVE